MNFLAHFHLARPTDASRVGALLGDFVRGTPASLATRFPAPLVEGIMLHRSVDQFTDLHPVFLRCKPLLSPPRRRFAGIIIDLFFDHLLSRQWSHYSDDGLDDFITEIHLTLKQRQAWLPEEVAEIVARMSEQNWLGSYRTVPGLALTLSRVSQRRPFLASLRGAEEDLVRHQREFEEAFAEFYPEVMSFAAGEKPGGAFNSP